MDRFIIDLKTGRKYKLAGGHGLPADTRLEVVDPDNGRRDAQSSVSGRAARNEAAADHERPVIGRFGRAHAAYLKRTQRHVYAQLAAEGKLGTYLAQIDEQANTMLELLIRQMAEREGVAEQLKAANQMEWVQHMNNIRNRGEEIVNAEVIYV